MSTDLALARLLQLASPALPVGAYSYSQGLESAVDAGLVHDAASAEVWIGDVLVYAVARLEAPLWWRLHAAWSANDLECVAHWNDIFRSTRECAELRAETLQMGYSLQQLLLEIARVRRARRWRSCAASAISPFRRLSPSRWRNGRSRRAAR